ncbi:MAG: hypothetical protein ACXAEX_21720, partial [Promethearchaeota archaeon]
NFNISLISLHLINYHMVFATLLILQLIIESSLIFIIYISCRFDIHFRKFFRVRFLSHNSQMDIGTKELNYVKFSNLQYIKIRGRAVVILLFFVNIISVEVAGVDLNDFVS